MKAIGGYFELELQKRGIYHREGIPLNTGRNALEFLLKNKQYDKVYLPHYSCNVLLEPLEKLGIDFEFYNINNKLEPIFSYNKLKNHQAFLYINYFGIKDNYIKKLITKDINLIIDNSQAFFSNPHKNVSTFYSCRKFFGVADGSYLFTSDIGEDENLPVDYSEDRIKHLLKRIERGPHEGYEYFLQNEDYLKGQDIKQMSLLTRALMHNIDFEYVKKRREKNFIFLHDTLKTVNEINLDFSNINGPLTYPLLINNGESIRRKLISENIFIPEYWPNIKTRADSKSYETLLAHNLLALPIDQRYNEKDMLYILKLLQL